MDEKNLITGCIGYATKKDVTNNDERYLTSGSMNVLINDSDKVESRLGYTVLGAEDTDRDPIESAFDWATSGQTVTGAETQNRNLRAYDEFLEVYVGTIENTGGTDRVFNSWEVVEDSFTAVDFSFDSYWDNTEKIDRLIFCNGTDDTYNWSGALATYASSAATTITLEGTSTWAQKRFLTGGTRQVRIKDSGGTWRTFTYTGGESTTTITGVTPDPTTFTFTAGALIMQEVITNSNVPASGFNADFLKVLNNQVWVGSNTSRLVYVSKNSSVTDFTFSTPRVAGDGALLTLDAVGRGFGRFRDRMGIFAGQDDIYVSEFEQITVSTTLSETLKIKKLKTTSGQSALHHDLIAEIGNEVAYVSFNNELLILQEPEEVESPLIRNVSDPIKPDFDAENFTNGHLKFNKNRLIVVSPVNSLMYILEYRQTQEGELTRFWQPPQNLPLRRLAVINGDLHGHSASITETYKLFDGLNDNDQPIAFKAYFVYRNAGKRDLLKNFDRHYTEMYIASNTTVRLKLLFEYGGAKATQQYEYKGTDSSFLFEPTAAASLGVNSLGTTSLGTTPNEPAELIKYRRNKNLVPVDFFEFQEQYECDEVDNRFQLLSRGPNMKLSGNYPVKITQ